MMVSARKRSKPVELIKRGPVSNQDKDELAELFQETAEMMKIRPKQVCIGHKME